MYIRCACLPLLSPLYSLSCLTLSPHVNLTLFLCYRSVCYTSFWVCAVTPAQVSILLTGLRPYQLITRTTSPFHNVLSTGVRLYQWFYGPSDLGSPISTVLPVSTLLFHTLSERSHIAAATQSSTYASPTCRFPPGSPPEVAPLFYRCPPPSETQSFVLLSRSRILSVPNCDRGHGPFHFQYLV